MPDRGAAFIMDLGGTGARALLVDQDRHIVARGPAANPNRVGTAASRACLVGLLRDLGLEGRSVRRAVIGMAGLSHPESRSIVRDAVSEVRVDVRERWLFNDAELAHLAAFRDRGGAGVLVVAGTGSIAVSTTLHGMFVRAGGLGPILGDEGSGHWIGSRLAELAHHDPVVRDALGALGWTAPRFALAIAQPSLLAESLDALAARFPAAHAIGVAAGIHLAELASEAYRLAGKRSNDVKASGSVLIQSRVVRAAFRSALEGNPLPMVDCGDVGDVLEEGMAWLLETDSLPVPPGW